MFRVIRYTDSLGAQRKLFLNSYANKDVDVWDEQEETAEAVMYLEIASLKREQQQEDVSWD